jgi:hypothetical protein
MIKINKSASVPAILTTDGNLETNNHINEYNANPDVFSSRLGVPLSSIRKIDFNKKIYGHKTVKNQLKIDQHYKCCFCEAKFSDNSPGDVEHYRPKKSYMKDGEKSLTYPGYYWLAYSWGNLMYSCEICNRTYKRNYFPLANELTRKEHHLHPNIIHDEDRLLIDPVNEDPSLFITFNKEIPKPVPGSRKGKVSIKVYGLERMNESRREHLFALRTMLSYAKLDETDAVLVGDAAKALCITPEELVENILYGKHLFNTAATDTAKFAHCVRCAFPHLPTI